MKALILFLALAVITMAENLDIENTLQNGNNQLSARMFSEVVKKNPNKNVVLSAFSVITPLAQLALASEGVSHEQILNALGFPDDDTTTAVISLIHEKLNSIKGVELKKASKLYIPVGHQVQVGFARLSKEVFHSEVANINFIDNINAAKEINTWVEEQTNHRIKELVSPDSIDQDTRGVLVNALYFKGSWKQPFQTSATTTQKFYMSKEETIAIPTMHITEQFKYVQSRKLKSKILELPYVGDQTSFLIVLPLNVDGIEELIEDLKDPNIIDEESKAMFSAEVRISIPKFKIETTTDLKKVLENLNVTKMFGIDARLTKLLQTNEKLFITDAVQKAFIEVNEEGAEAAASNSFGIGYAGSFGGSITYEFTADHPFVFFLKENNEILFSGVFCGQ